MTLIFECIQTDGIAQLSYLVGDDSTGTAAVFDPRPDVECYLELAREKKLAITHIFETHIHVDYASGARELRARVGSAKLYLSHEGGARYGFDHEGFVDGDVFAFGSVLIVARHTPGHSPEHMAFLLSEKDHPDTPWGVLTGDSLFVSSAGRPDLLGSSREKELAKKLFHTLHDFYLNLDDGVIILPTHAQGSPCGTDIGDRLSSTIGYERRFNPFLRFNDAKSFTGFALADPAPIPTYYPRMGTLNTEGQVVLGNLPPVRGLPPRLFRKATEDRDNVLIDTRMMLAFGGGHIKGALSIGGSPMLSIWAGWLLEPARPILLVLESDEKLETVVRYLVRTGFTKFAGYLVGGMEAWNNAGLPLDSVGQMTVHEVQAAGEELQILDVRAPEEWNDGHIPDAGHVFLGELREHLGGLDKSRPTAVYCDSGYRASIATSILLQQGFGRVHNIPGSWQAWENAGYPIARRQRERA